MLSTKQKVEILCEIYKINISTVEKAIGISGGAIAKWDQSTPKSNTLLKLAQYFHVTPESLIDQSDNVVSSGEEGDRPDDKKAEIINLLDLLNLSDDALDMAKDMLVSIKKNVDNRLTSGAPSAEPADQERQAAEPQDAKSQPQ